ncbi:5-histidylcysteine sulfoxide synthase [Psychroflexus montanilacus]|uniref:5-histidylcysteine sulfoxide synthase n=1 Tax=Psychroflexus montanilacus TaxID=2873598 RepID=UPI001CCE4FBC|nr:5-histidylcysteine sulfoxide synthase [Psychroflexus montanilacus]MBZ9652825.1 5-histidylcysteine sulfoxide synthase [Psychroflexus montanilacus]
MKEFNIKTPVLTEGSVEDKRQEILDYFNRTFELDTQLYNTLKDEEAFYMRADPLRHPIIFYYGHTSVFFVNKLVLAGLLPEHINPHFESIFAIGVDEMSWDDLNEENYDWPTVAEVREYRKTVKAEITKLIKELPLELPINWENAFWPILMGIEHQNIHIETSSVLIRQLPIEKLQTGIFTNVCHEDHSVVANELIAIKGSEIQLGKVPNHPLYGWDLEYGSFEEQVEDFKASKYLVSNAEFLEFIEDGGYQDKKWWTEEGWSWCTYKEAEHPQFWIKENDSYKLRLMTQIVPMKWSFPAEINYLEAKAFCNWKSAKTGKTLRLPTEAEWYKLIEVSQVKDAIEWDVAPGNINLEHYSSSCPVDSFAFGDFYDLMGNVWQWTETPITGYPGFKVHPLYDDFSTPTFDGKHNLIKGGSWISTGNEATLNARYAFRRHFYQHAGFRYVESEFEPEIRVDSYETDEEVTISCEHNYGDDYLGMTKLPLQVLEVLKNHIENPADKKLLDLNCDTGRLAFEAIRHFKEVTAIDASARFIRPAIELQKNGLLRYVIKDEGELSVFKDVVLKDLKLDNTLDHLQFMQDDVMKLKERYTGYDVIVAMNLLEDIRQPKAVLSRIHERLNAGGTLILGSTYAWESSTSEVEHWPGGFKKDGEPVRSIDGITDILSKHFNLVTEPLQLTYPIRQSSRSFEVQRSEVSIWRKKS